MNTTYNLEEALVLRGGEEDVGVDDDMIIRLYRPPVLTDCTVIQEREEASCLKISPSFLVGWRL